MQDKLIIILQPNDIRHPTCLLVRNDITLVDGDLEHDPLFLSKMANDREVIVWVPPEDITFLVANLPKMNRTRLAQALPFALEEQLVDEIESLHFAPGTSNQENQTPVAICSKEKMQIWLDLLKEWEIEPDLMTSLTLALPFETGHCYGVIHQGKAILRYEKYKGLICEVESLPDFLSFVINEGQLLPDSIHIKNYDDSSLPHLGGVEVLSSSPAQFYIDLATQFLSDDAINLLQGKMVSKKSKIHKGKLWKLAAFLSLSWVAFIFLYPTVSYFILKQHLSGLNNEITTIYQRHFPGSKSFVAPKLRMEEKLKKLSVGGGQNRLLTLIAYVGKAMKDAVPVKLKRMDFQNNQLILEISASDSDQFAAFTDYLSKEGLKVKQQNANLVGERINATLQIE